MEQPGVEAGNFGPSFSLNILSIFVHISGSIRPTLWSGHHWKDLFLLQKLSVDDDNFGQKWWRQKWKKGQGLSQAVTGSTGVNGLIQIKWCLITEKRMRKITKLMSCMNFRIKAVIKIFRWSTDQRIAENSNCAFCSCLSGIPSVSNGNLGWQAYTPFDLWNWYICQSLLSLATFLASLPTHFYEGHFMLCCKKEF